MFKRNWKDLFSDMKKSVMKIKFSYHGKKGYSMGKFDLYHIAFKPPTYILDIWRISIFLIFG